MDSNTHGLKACLWIHLPVPFAKSSVCQWSLWDETAAGNTAIVLQRLPRDKLHSPTPLMAAEKKTFPQVSTSENTVSIKLMLPRVSPQVRNSSESSGLSDTGWLSQRQAVNFPYYSIKLHQPTNETSSVQFILVGKVTELKHRAGLLAFPWLCYHVAPQKATTQ